MCEQQLEENIEELFDILFGNGFIFNQSEVDALTKIFKKNLKEKI